MRNLTKYFLPALLFFLASCAGSHFTEEGKASYYSSKLEGRKMANGEKYRAGHLTAAHKTLPFGTKIKVTNLQTHKTVKVKITDRGPYAPGRILDLSYRAADKLELVKTGVALVKLKVIKQGKK